MKAFTDTLWKGLAILICLGIAVFVGWYLIKRGKNPITEIRKAYGKITNPTKESDTNRASAIRDALTELWND